MITTLNLREAIEQKQPISCSFLDRVFANSSREELIEFMVWNDPNGCFRDEDSRLEGLTLEEVRTLMIDRLTYLPNAGLAFFYKKEWEGMSYTEWIKAVEATKFTILTTKPGQTFGLIEFADQTRLRIDQLLTEQPEFVVVEA